MVRMADKESDKMSEEMHGEGSAAQDEKIYVSVRIRPLNEKEIARNDVSEWECINRNTIVCKSSLPERSLYPSAYTFDRVFGVDCPTKQVYEEAARDIALSVLGGVNSTIFAYGQTSSGKTYTMSGITGSAIADIFSYIEQHKEREFVLKFSAIEIYNEAVRDLLSSDTTPLRLLDDPDKGTVVEKLIEEILEDWNQLEQLLAICEAQRQIGETSSNENSSRSHQILRLMVESSAREYAGAANSSTLVASVNFVDLAGSERASQTLSAGARLKEGCHINRSLLTLGTVIRKLSKGRNAHVPYRDSKLTRILQNSLGGNARTAIICTISPARSHVEQSRNTLLFASCAKEVSTNAQVNLVMSDKALVKQLQRELARLENELKGMESGSIKPDSATLLREKEQLIEQMAREIQELTRERDLAQSRVENILRSVGDVEVVKQDEVSAPQSSNLANASHLNVYTRHGNEPSQPASTNKSIEVSENLEDNFLLDGSPKFGPDSSPGWEKISHRTDEESEDACKEVRCIEIEQSSIKTNVKADFASLGADDTLSMTELNINKSEAEVFSIEIEKKERTEDVPPIDLDEKLTEAEDLIKKTESDRFSIEIDELDIKMNVKPEVSSFGPEVKVPVAEEIVKSAEAYEFSDDPVEKEGTRPTNVEVVSCPPDKDNMQPSPEKTDETYDDLKRKVQELQRTINYLVSLNPPEQSPCSSVASTPSSSSLTRSRSCRPVLTNVQKGDQNVSTPAAGSEYDFPGRPEGLPRRSSGLRYDSTSRKFSRKASQASLVNALNQLQSREDLDVEETTSNRDLAPDWRGRPPGRLHEPPGSRYGSPDENLSRRASETSLSSISVETLSLKDLDMEYDDSGLDLVPELHGVDKAELEKKKEDKLRRRTLSLDFAPSMKETKPPLPKHFDHALVQEATDRNSESGESTKDIMQSPSSWPLEFERQQRKIIELWDACNVPLIHRTYFFLLFKGDPSDAVYMEVEFRRLSFLKNSGKGSRLFSTASSMKDLIRERGLLSKQIQKKLTKKEREDLFKKWGVGLKSKQRSLQVARRLWTDTKDMNHVRESAALVARLVGIVEPGQAPKEIFGLSFLPRNQSWKSYGWKQTISMAPLR